MTFLLIYLLREWSFLNLHQDKNISHVKWYPPLSLSLRNSLSVIRKMINVYQLEYRLISVDYRNVCHQDRPIAAAAAATSVSHDGHDERITAGNGNCKEKTDTHTERAASRQRRSGGWGCGEDRRTKRVPSCIECRPAGRSVGRGRWLERSPIRQSITPGILREHGNRFLESGSRFYIRL